jgi:hypothetical protein
MDFSDDAPQVGPVDVDRNALGEQGASLVKLIAELGVLLDSSSASDAPPEGWRVLKRFDSGALVIGAPVDSGGTSWRVAHVEPQHAGSVATVQPEPMPLRPSRAVRRRGLELRWPALMTSDPPTADFVVDIVNTGPARWESDLDGFYVVGVFTAPGSTDFSFGWMTSSQQKAVPLDPGEYARVSVSINAGVWNTLEPGTHDLHAVLVSLGLRTVQPLSVELTSDTIAENRKRNTRPTSSPSTRRRMLEQQIQQIHARVSASKSLDRVASAVMAAQTDDDAISSISRLVSIDERMASSIYHSALRDLRPNNVQRDQRLQQLIAEGDTLT